MAATLISVGGIPIQINFPVSLTCLEDNYVPFRISSASPDVVWNIQPESISRNFSSSQKLSSLPINWKTVQRDGKKEFFLPWKTGDISPYKTARMENDCSRGDIWIEKRESENTLISLYPLDMILCSNLLLHRGGMIIHAAAVKINDEAFLFPASSGRGKSTWADLAHKLSSWSVLGEDKIILKKSGDDYLIFGTPWNHRQKFQVAESATLRGIFFLHHRPENQIEKINQLLAIQEILQQAFLPFNDRDELDRAVSILEDVIHRIPFYSFGFRPDQSALDYFQSFQINNSV